MHPAGRIQYVAMNATTTATSVIRAESTEHGTRTLDHSPQPTVHHPRPDLRAERLLVEDSNLRATHRRTPAADDLAAPAEPGPRRAGRRLALTMLAGVLLVASVFVGYRWWRYASTWVSTDNAYVAAHIHTVSPRVAGTVEEVLVDENQPVAAGALLARLDPRDLEVRRQQALAQVAQARAQLQQAEANIAQARAQVSREQARATKAQQDSTRAKSLYEGSAGAISRQEFDQAQAEAQAADAALAGARSALDSAAAAATAAQAQEKVALAAQQDAELQLSYTSLVAPAAGRIGKKNLETGNRVHPGQAVLALVEPEAWVTANFKETQLARMKPGQPAKVRVDAFPGRMFSGKLDSLSPASGAQFALLPPDNATGNFTKIVQRVPVKIVLDAASLQDCADRLAPGMSAVVEVRVGE